MLGDQQLLLEGVGRIVLRKVLIVSSAAVILDSAPVITEPVKYSFHITSPSPFCGFSYRGHSQYPAFLLLDARLSS